MPAIWNWFKPRRTDLHANAGADHLLVSYVILMPHSLIQKPFKQRGRDIGPVDG
jgi:hypothetical protein